MNVKELIAELQKVEDKSLEVRCIDVADTDDYNAWAYKVEESSTGSSGYELSGEVRILASE
tara:strand:+ start:472 stop:654 length:183 start_codon:yes stop_codon:yes gene_type:complete